MKVRLVLIAAVLSLLPFAMGCGFCRDWLYRPGAPCNACGGAAPGLVPLSGGPCETGCCGSHAVEVGCGGETIGSYYGGVYSNDGVVIGDSGYGADIYGAAPFNGRIPASDWIPSDPNYVPNSAYLSETGAGMSATPNPAP